MTDPQVNPNALGAPAEGFGQTVSFAFDPRGAPPQLQLQKSRPAGMGVSGVSNSRGTDPNTAFQQPPPKDGTAELLMKVGADILGPMVEQERNAKFVQGMQTAMSGAAITDIAKEQPWYSKIFGSTPMLDGARAFTAQARVNDVVSQQAANMTQLQELGPADAAKHFAGVIQSAMTGDDGTDALVMKGMTDALPSLMKAQAKAAYGYGQKKLSAAYTNNMDSAASALQQFGTLHGNDTVNDPDMAVLKGNAVKSIMAPDGMDPTVAQNTLADGLRMAAEKGNFHFINAIRESGGFNILKADQRMSVEAAIDKGAAAARNKYAYTYGADMAALESDALHRPTGESVNDIKQRFDNMNAAFTKATGNTQGLYTSDEIVRYLTGGLNEQKADIKAAARADLVAAGKMSNQQAKDALLAQKDAEVSRLVSNGQIGAAKLAGATESDVDRKIVELYDQQRAAGHEEIGVDYLRRAYVNSGYGNKFIAEREQLPFRQAQNLAQPSDAALAGIARYKSLKQGIGGTGIADKYFGEWAPKIEAYLNMTAGDPTGTGRQLAWASAFGPDTYAKHAPMSAKDHVAFTKAVASSQSSLVPAWAGGAIPPREDALNAVSQLALPSTQLWMNVPGLSDEQRVERGINSALNRGEGELIGGYFSRNPSVAVDGKAVPSLRELANGGTVGKHVGVQMPNDKTAVDHYFKDFLEKDQKIPASGDTVIERNGTNAVGEPNFVVTHRSSNGEYKVYQFGAAQWRQYAATRAVQQADKPMTQQAFEDNRSVQPTDLYNEAHAWGNLTN